MTRWFARNASCLVLLFLLGSTIAAAADAPACPPAAKPFSPELFDAAARQARDRGPLWRITRDGHSSYLYGTIHVGKAQWVAPGPLVKRALQQTDMLALELDPLDEAVQREMAAALAAKGPGKLPAALQARVKKTLGGRVPAGGCRGPDPGGDAGLDPDLHGGQPGRF